MTERERKKKEVIISENEIARFDKIVNDNLEFIESKCFFIVNSKGYFHDNRVEAENESIELFNLVITKLKKDNYKSLRSYKSRAKFSTYLSAVISFTYVDYIRRKRGRSGMSLLQPAEGSAVHNGYIKDKNGSTEISDKRNNPETDMIDRERKKLESDAIKKISTSLSGEDKLMLKMRFQIGENRGPVPVKKISEILGISEKAVYKRINRALEKCRKILLEAGISADDLFWEKK